MHQPTRSARVWLTAWARPVKAGSASRSQEGPASGACTDPKGDLPYSYASGLESRTSFTNKRYGPPPEQEATRPNIAAALSQLPPLGPGIFYCAGHVRYLDVAGGLNAVLELQDGDVIGAGDWMHIYGRPELNSPCRAVIWPAVPQGHQAQAGVNGSGLGTALLAAGARQVIATAWPILDTAFGDRFDTSLVTELREASDPAATLAACPANCTQRMARFAGDTCPGRVTA
jgi:hypothetical protein